MSQFEYITVFLSIVVALAVAELLAGLGRLIREREHIEIYWVHVSWMVLAILALTSSWWAIWGIRDYAFTSYFQFLALMLPSFMFVITAFVLSPPIESGRAFDLRAYYFRQIRWVAPLFAAQLVALALSRVGLGVEHPLAAVNGIRIAVAGVLLYLSFSGNERVHGAAVFVVCGFFALSLFVASVSGGHA